MDKLTTATSLARLLGIDRRTLKKRLYHIRPTAILLIGGQEIPLYPVELNTQAHSDALHQSPR